jgi:CBS domain-containing protein
LATPQHELKRKLPGIVDIAYEQYKRNLKNFQTAEEIMSRNVVTTTPEAPLVKVAKIMGERHIGSLIVYAYKTPVGIVTERDLLSKILAYGEFIGDEKVQDVMSYPLLSVSFSAKIKQVAQLMISKKGRLAVYEAGNLVGVVSASDLIRSLPDVDETEVQVDDFMTKEVVAVDEEEFVINVAKIMGEQRIGSVIITHKGEPFGIFTERDLLTNFIATNKSMYTQLGPVCSHPLVVLPSGASVHRAAAAMALKHIRRLPVVKDDKLVGIITARDLVEAYAK